MTSTLFGALTEAAKSYGYSKVVLEDLNGSLNYRKLIISAYVIAKKINSDSRNIAILLPTTIAAAITFFAAQSLGKISVMLNFTLGSRNLLNCCKLAQITEIITSRKFIHEAGLTDLVATLHTAGIRIIYLEDLKTSISFIDKISACFKSYFPYQNRQTNPTDPAIILFTSGSENTPKAVLLSHQNIISNIEQIESRIAFTPKDIMFNVLPIFHSFGLTVGTLLPLLRGLKTFLYPSPLHYKIIPKMIEKSKATILFGTDTFLSHYSKYASRESFKTIRYIFAGAEKLRDETFKEWQQKFGVLILQGYGVTEAAPVISVNSPQDNKIGTAGRLLPNIEYKIKKEKDINQGGRLFVKGPNIMLGYIKKNGKILCPKNSYHDTGDIVTIDKENYVTIIGRAKRFAKIAGEMISLTNVESYIRKIWPDNLHAVLSVPSTNKGEQLVLITDKANGELQELVHKLVVFR